MEFTKVRTIRQSYVVGILVLIGYFVLGWSIVGTYVNTSAIKRMLAHRLAPPGANWHEGRWWIKRDDVDYWFDVDANRWREFAVKGVDPLEQ